MGGNADGMWGDVNGMGGGSFTKVLFQYRARHQPITIEEILATAAVPQPAAGHEGAAMADT
eukprot:1780527-Pyramimonas_sp.AAC.1